MSTHPSNNHDPIIRCLTLQYRKPAHKSRRDKDRSQDERRGGNHEHGRAARIVPAEIHLIYSILSNQAMSWLSSSPSIHLLRDSVFRLLLHSRAPTTQFVRSRIWTVKCSLDTSRSSHPLFVRPFVCPLVNPQTVLSSQWFESKALESCLFRS